MTRLALLTAELALAQSEYRQASYAEQLHPYGSEEYHEAREGTLAAARRVREVREDLEREGTA